MVGGQRWNPAYLGGCRSSSCPPVAWGCCGEKKRAVRRCQRHGRACPGRGSGWHRLGLIRAMGMSGHVQVAQGRAGLAPPAPSISSAGLGALGGTAGAAGAGGGAGWGDASHAARSGRSCSQQPPLTPCVSFPPRSMTEKEVPEPAASPASGGKPKSRVSGCPRGNSGGWVREPPSQRRLCGAQVGPWSGRAISHLGFSPGCPHRRGARETRLLFLWGPHRVPVLAALGCPGCPLGEEGVSRSEQGGREPGTGSSAPHTPAMCDTASPAPAATEAEATFPAKTQGRGGDRTTAQRGAAQPLRGTHLLHL